MPLQLSYILYKFKNIKKLIKKINEEEDFWENKEKKIIFRISIKVLN